MVRASAHRVEEGDGSESTAPREGAGMTAFRLTHSQRTVLRYLHLWRVEGFIPSSHFRFREVKDPGPILKRLAARGLVECNGVNIPGEGLCYRITDAGVEAMA